MDEKNYYHGTDTRLRWDKVTPLSNPLITPVLPDWPGLAWRPITRNDLATLGELAGACHRTDGGLTFMNEPENLLERFFPNRPGAALGAFNAAGQMVAGAAVHLTQEVDTERAVIAGQVRPDMRRQGIGTFLMKWSAEQAQALFTDSPAGKRALQVTTESLTDSAERLYASFGYKQIFESLVMRRDFHKPLPECPFPPDITIAAWQPGLAEPFYQAYEPAFRDRPGFPGWSAAEWISKVLANDFKPEWSFLARQEGVPVGFVIGTIDLTTDPPGGFIWQVGVIPAQRRRGICSALMAESMRQMQSAGANWALLTVHINNPGAIETYNQIGFMTAGRRARYERIAGQ